MSGWWNTCSTPCKIWAGTHWSGTELTEGLGRWTDAWTRICCGSMARARPTSTASTAGTEATAGSRGCSRTAVATMPTRAVGLHRLEAADPDSDPDPAPDPELETAPASELETPTPPRPAAVAAVAAATTGVVQRQLPGPWQRQLHQVTQRPAR